MTTMKRKAQGLPFNTIVLAIIALGILVVVILIFTGQIGKASQNLGSCSAKGGKCASELGGKCDSDYPIPLYVSGGCTTGTDTAKDLCCLKAPSGD